LGARALNAVRWPGNAGQEHAKVPEISYSATSKSLSAAGSYYFRTCAPDSLKVGLVFSSNTQHV
jgi:hypothetical protein